MSFVRIALPNTNAGHTAMLLGAGAVLVPFVLVQVLWELPDWSYFVVLVLATVVPVYWGATTLRVSEGQLFLKPVGAFSRGTVQSLATVADVEVWAATDGVMATKVVLTLLLTDGRRLTVGPWGRMSRARLEQLRTFVADMKLQQASRR